jgi:amino acid transporter
MTAVPSPTELTKRLVVGRALRSEALGETLLPKRIALPVFASDALSSVAYAPDEILLTLSLGGLTAYAFSWQIGVVVAIVMATVVASYRQNVHAYPSGGGDYEVSTVNIGPRAGLSVASALLVDYVLTVAVSVSSGVQNAAAAIPSFRGHEVQVAVALVIILVSLNLRGVRESGAIFAIPTYAFMVGILGMVIWGFLRSWVFHDLPLSSTAGYTIVPESQYADGFAGIAAVFLLMRAFSSGCAALTGVEAISNGVPAFRKPKSKNAATTLLLMGTVAIAMMLGIIALANKVQLRYVEDPSTQLLSNGVPVGDSYVQNTVLAQLSSTVFDHFTLGFYLVTAATGVVLVLAANTAFNGFPVLGSVLARDGYLPRQLHTRGDRLAFSNGIIVLAAVALVLIIAFDAEVTRLIQLYIVGVFVSFTMSQAGMVRHWTRLLRGETDPGVRRRMIRSRLINGFGLCMTGLVLVIVLVTKFAKGAWIAIAAMAVLYVIMRGIRRHYDRVRTELTIDDDEAVTLPSRVYGIVLVSKIHKPTLRALAYARATRPTILEAVTVDVEEEETARFVADWEARGIPVQLRVLDSPYREVTRPVVDYVKGLRRAGPRDLVTVYIPEYVVGHWWEHLLHNQSALRLKSRLLFTPGVMVVSVPWQLLSSEAAAERPLDNAPGAVRRGEPTSREADAYVEEEFVRPLNVPSARDED